MTTEYLQLIYDEYIPAIDLPPGTNVYSDDIVVTLSDGTLFDTQVPIYEPGNGTSPTTGQFYYKFSPGKVTLAQPTFSNSVAQGPGVFSTTYPNWIPLNLPDGKTVVQDDLGSPTVSLSTTTLQGGGSVTINGEVSNLGAVPSTASEIKFYLSTDSTITSSDQLIGFADLAAIAAGGTASFSFVSSVPNTPGTYYIGGLIDTEGDANPGNNTTAPIQVTISPGPTTGVDLTATFSMSAGTIVPIGGFVFPVAGVQNKGTSASPAFNYGIYLSTDATISTNDLLLQSFSLSGLNAGSGALQSLSSYVTIPKNIAPGHYYLGIIVDYDNKVTEFNETNNTFSTAITVFSPTAVVHTYNGDAISDVLFRNNTSGDTGFYAVVNGANAGWRDIGASSTAYSVVGVGDFTGDYNSDILYRNNSSGDLGFYGIVNGVNTGWNDFGASSSAYSVVGVGDFNGDQIDDVLFRNNGGAGDIGFYEVTPSMFYPKSYSVSWHDIGPTATAYSVAGVGDFNGDGTEDVLFRNNGGVGDTGFYAIVNGVNAGWHDLGASSTAYSVVGVGDFNGDGTSDILYRNNTTGDTGFYAIVNSANAGWHDIGASSTAYNVVAVGDYNGDGTSDVLYRNNVTGDTGFYAIVNGVNAGWHDIGASSTAYHVAG